MINFNIYCQTAENSSNADTIKAALPMERISHLSSAHQQYFLQWSRMLRIEWEESSFRSRSISDIWCLDPLDREAQGRCFSHLQVVSYFEVYLSIRIDSIEVLYRLTVAKHHNFPLQSLINIPSLSLLVERDLYQPMLVCKLEIV